MEVMERDERKRPRARRSFTAAFKAEIVELCQRGDRSIGQVWLAAAGVAGHVRVRVGVGGGLWSSLTPAR